MKKYRVEFGFTENFQSVNEWQTMDGLEEVDAENAEEAAKWAACTDGLENALFRVYELDGLEKHGQAKYFDFSD